MLDKLKLFFNKLNESGVPLPLVRDPKSGTGSFSATLLFISSTVVLIGLIGKMAKLVDGVDITQAIYWFVACASLYFGRNLSNNNGNIKLDSNDKEGNNN